MRQYIDRGAGIYLRPITWEGTELILKWRNADSVRKHFIYQEPFTREGHENWIRTMIDTGRAVQMILCSLTEDRPIGSVYIRDIDRVHNKAEYGIFIGEDTLRGRGIGTAAARLMLQYCFEEEGLHRIYLRALSDNLQAIRSYEKAGFEREACLRDDVRIEGEYRDIIWMAVLGTQWKEGRA